MLAGVNISEGHRIIRAPGNLMRAKRDIRVLCPSPGEDSRCYNP